jgi:hypothetical protein
MKKLFSFIFFLSFTFNLTLALGSTDTQESETDNEELRKFYRNFPHAWNKESWVFPTDFSKNPSQMDQTLFKAILKILKGRHGVRTVIEGDHLYRIFDRYSLTEESLKDHYTISLSKDEYKSYNEEMGRINGKTPVLAHYWGYDVDKGQNHPFSITIVHTLLSETYELPLEVRKKYTDGQLLESKRQMARPPSTQVEGKEVGKELYREMTMHRIEQAYLSKPSVTTEPIHPKKDDKDQIKFRPFHLRRLDSDANLKTVYSQARKTATQDQKAEPSHSFLKMQDDETALVRASPSETASPAGTFSDTLKPKKKRSLKKAATSAALLVEKQCTKVKELRAKFETDGGKTTSSSSSAVEVTRSLSPKKKEKEKKDL